MVAKFPATMVSQSIFEHCPGVPLRGVVKMFGCKVKAGPTIHNLLFTYETYEVTYYTYDVDETRIDQCPMCNAVLPTSLGREVDSP